MLANDCDCVSGRVVYFGDSVYHNGYLLDDAEHIGHKHQMVLSDVQSAEVGEVAL